MNNGSIWLSQPGDLQLQSRPLQSTYDVVVIGAGIAGASAAYHLASLGSSVALLESRSIFEGVTGNTTGKLTAQHGLIYHHLTKTFGEEFARHYAEANFWAIDFAQRVSIELGIDCDFGSESAFVYSQSDTHRTQLDDETSACQKLGVIVSSHEDVEMAAGRCRAIEMPNQARFHPVKLLRGLVDFAQKQGITIAQNARALHVDEKDDHVDIELSHFGRVTAKQVVIATHYPIHDSGWFVAKLAPYRSYAAAYRLKGEPQPGMYISEGEPMRSMRPHYDETGAYQIVGGEHHKVGQDSQTSERYKAVDKWAREHFDIDHLAYQWSTQDNWTPDRVPYIGLSPHRKRIYVATGFGGWGMTNGLVAGKIIADQILGVANPWSEVFNPSRMELAAIPKIVSENINVATHLVGDRFRSAEIDSLDKVGLGQAAIVQLEDRRVAAYRDESGILHAVSSACTHLGCQVAWNEAEQTWDCPCHGSRFGIDGEVIHGPATKPLPQNEPAPVM